VKEKWREVNRKEKQSLHKSMAALAQQAITHQREVAVLAVNLQRHQEALRDAIRLLDATRRNEWTPADTKRLEEIRLLSIGV
jgi:hypothetical protein